MDFNCTKIMNMQSALQGMRNPMNSWDKADTYSGVMRVDDFEGDNNALTDVITEQEKWLGDDFSFQDEFPNGEIKEYFRNNGILDTYVDPDGEMYIEYVFIGPNDMRLAQNLVRGGSEHRKFMRQIFVSVEITAPLYWWKEFDTQKIGTVANSTSTMHKLATTPITIDCFEIDDMSCLFEVDNDNKEQIHHSDKYYLYQDDEGDNMICQFIDYLEDLRQKYLDTKDKRYWKELIRWLPESWLQTRTVTMNYENIRNMVAQRRGHKLSEWSESFINWAKNLPYADRLIFYALPKS